MKYSKNNEWFIKDDDKIYFYDLTLPKIKLIIEYHGSHVHPNPTLNEHEKSTWMCPFTKDDFWSAEVKYSRKRNAAILAGFKIIEVFDVEREERLEEIKNEIKKSFDEYERSLLLIE